VAGEHGRLERHQLEHDLTWRYLDQYLPAQGAILEIGAATGRYTLELAKRGYRITAVDLSPAMIEASRERLAADGYEARVRLVVADTRDLDEVGAAHFDAVLLMGPLYHLRDEADRRKALQEAYDRLRPGGVLFSSHISRFGIMGDLMKEHAYWIEDQAYVRSVLKNGRRPEDKGRGGFRSYLCDPAEIVPLHEAVGFSTQAFAGVEPAIAAEDEIYNRLEEPRRALWLDLLEAISQEPSILGASRHLLYVGEKA
jgi:S-adenosylmethionine-dependent methyltransferase